MQSNVSQIAQEISLHSTSTCHMTALQTNACITGRTPPQGLIHFCSVFAAALLGLLGVLDFLFVNHACHSIITRGASVQLVFGFEVGH